MASNLEAMGLQPNSDGLQPKSDGLQPTGDGLQRVVFSFQTVLTESSDFLCCFVRSAVVLDAAVLEDLQKAKLQNAWIKPGSDGLQPSGGICVCLLVSTSFLLLLVRHLLLVAMHLFLVASCY